MTEDQNNEELLSVLEEYIDNSSASSNSEADSDVAQAIDYYYGKPYGNEVQGRSQVVTRELLESLEWALPPIIKAFASGDRFVEFDPTGPEDIDQSEQETEYVNHLIIKKNNGWKMMYDWFKGAMLQKNGYTKAFVEEKKKITTTPFSGISAEGVIAMQNSYENAEFEEVEEDGIDELTGEDTYKFSLVVTEKKKEIKAACIPPEEMRVWDDWNQLSLDGCPFMAHERYMSLSELVAMGFDREELLEASGGDDEETNGSQTRDARDRYDTGSEEEDISDESQQRIFVSECYVLFDDDGDGISEQLQVWKIGDKVFEKNVLDEQPFATISPLPMPHRHLGLSYGELVMDVQLVKSTLIRQMLDNLYLTNNPEKEVVSDMVTMEDLMVSVPGGIKRVEALNSIRELTVPFTAGQSMPMLQIMDGIQESRTGVSRGSMGMDADKLAQSTRGAFLGAMENASQKIEMISRVFAETGVKELFRKFHKLAITHMDKPEVIRLRGKYVPVTPTEWSDRADLTAVVGLGSGNRDQQLSHLQLIAGKQEEHLKMGSPMVNLKNLYHTYDKMLNIVGFKDTTKFFEDPSTEQFQQKMQQQAQEAQNEVSDTDKMLQAQALIEQGKNQTKIATEQISTQADLQKFAKDLEYKYDKLTADLEEKMTELELTHDTDVPGSVV